MKQVDLNEAVREAKRFIERAKPLLAQDTDKYVWMFGNKDTAAVRRASMDLTRALANLRRSG